MKLVVTIFQTKRAVLPYLNINYTLPAMQEVFPGEMVVYLIQHRGAANLLNRTKCFFETKNLSDKGFKTVREWTEEGKYGKAIIKPHSIHLGRYPSLPSMTIGLELALQENADYHLWLEDDAIIYDLDCVKWNQLLSGEMLGVYDRFKDGNSKFVKSAWVVTTNEYDQKAFPFFKNTANWNCRSGHKNTKQQVTSRLEGALFYLANNRIKVFEKEGKVARMHLGNNIEQVIDIIKKVATNEIPLLAVDFPEEWKRYNE